jgi:hypothetical protein
MEKRLSELESDLEYYEREAENFRNDGWVREGFMRRAREIRDEIENEILRSSRSSS